MGLEGKVAIVTGAARGLGFAIARRFAGDGAKVVVADIDDQRGAQAVEELNDIGEAGYVHCNVGERLDVRNLVAATLDRYGDIDILMNNAGIVHGASFIDLKEADFDRVLQVNLKGSFLVGQAVARHLVERVEGGGEPGVIVNMSSINAVLAIESQIPYSISKGGISQLTKVMALSLAPHGIRVNAIGPGSIMTEMMDAVNSDKAAKTRVLSRTPLGRIGEPHEVAAVAAFLVSDEASYMTGQTIYVDGGRLPLNYTVPVAKDG